MFAPSGTATIRGTIACSGDVQFVEINLSLSQRVGRFLIRGFGGVFEEGCATSPTPWSIDVTSEEGKFLGGPAQVNAFAFACGAIECTDDFVSRTVRLRR